MITINLPGPGTAIGLAIAVCVWAIGVIGATLIDDQIKQQVLASLMALVFVMVVTLVVVEIIHRAKKL